MATYSEEDKLELLRNILFQEEKAHIERIDTILESKEPLAERVVPIIEEQLQAFEEHFPKSYQLAVDRLVAQKIKQSQDEILNLIYPVMGKMIRKYIAQQLQELRESVEEQLQKSFIGRLRERLSSRAGLRKSDRIIRQAAMPRVREAYVIEQHSGLLLGSASTQTVVDRDLIAGMLTAIKSFAVDAFRRGDTQLEMIAYAGYQILIYDFHTYFVALAVEGTLTAKEQADFSAQMHTFAAKELSRGSHIDDPAAHLLLGQRLQLYFMKPPQS